MPNFDLTALAVQGVCPGNEVLYDDKGLPSIMVKVPKMTYAQLGMGASTAIHPAFIVNGTEVDAIYISKYQNIVQNNRAYSLPGVDPRTGITFDGAREACENKGDGWHLMTRMERGLLIRWMQNNGFMPLGNNNYGKHSSERVYKAIPTSRDGNNIARTATGTGPLTWYHDQSPSGIADLCGNVWEWDGGVRTVAGELQLLVNNNGADSAKSQGVNSTEWRAIRASDGELITPNGSGTTSGTIKMDCQSQKLVYNTSITGATGSGTSTYSSCTFANISCASAISDAAKLLLQNLGFLMYGTESELFASHLNYWDNTQAERSFCSGGDWHYSSYGAASFNGNNARSYSSGGIGFRAAFVKLPTA